MQDYTTKKQKVSGICPETLRWIKKECHVKRLFLQDYPASKNVTTKVMSKHYLSAAGKKTSRTDDILTHFTTTFTTLTSAGCFEKVAPRIFF